MTLPNAPPVDVKILPEMGMGLGNVVVEYDFKPDGLTFDPPAILTIVVDVTLVTASKRDKLYIYVFDPDLKVYISAETEPCPVDEDPPLTFTLTCEIEVSHFSLFAVIAPADTDDDGVPDLFPPESDNCRFVFNPGQEDGDGDGVGDVCDNCPAVFNPGQEDTDANGIGDACPLESPVLTATPQACDEPIIIRRNRYLAVDPRGATGINFGQDFDIKLTLTNTLVASVTAIGSSWWANDPDTECISVVGPSQPATAPNWDACPTLYLTGCPVIPTSLYDIVAVEAGGIDSSPPTVGETQLKPGVKWFGDAVGIFCGVDWEPPNGTTNIDDTVAAIKTFQNPNAINAT
ncbi:MAG: thrombospondin type 3 repeat-containing protein, partial [Planctomycetes bacterium]|nr:thrombospondin type 3 repeat-containing protein [Planctomycetota bacterium]